MVAAGRWKVVNDSGIRAENRAGQWLRGAFTVTVMPPLNVFSNHRMSLTTLSQLEVYGPDRCDTLSPEQARAWCRRLAEDRYENFSVLSAVVPQALRDDFAAVYAFCRWADDLGDEMGSRERSLNLLAWWRRELQQCYSGMPRHPVFLALSPTIRRHQLPIEPFDDLIRAFEQDQQVTRYDSWAQLLGYCRLSANPVGRLVLMMCGEPRTDDLFHLADCTCTALQLTNHWQDVQRDVVDRDRIYVPRELHRIHDFESRLIASARQGYAVDQAFLAETRTLVRCCVERTWPLYEQGSQLLNRVHPRMRPVVWLLSAGGQRVLRMIELWNFETALHRPALGRLTKLGLIARAWLSARRASGRRDSIA